MSLPGAAVAETHVSILFFTGDRAYKVKKPVRTPFLDFSTPEARHRACLREVELNRRLAPDVYLGVASVTGPDGTPCDHLVVMRRMPSERRLSTLVTTGDVPTGCLEQIARVMAGFHATAATSPLISAEGTRDAVRGRWEANLAEMEPFVSLLPEPAVHDRIAGLARAYLAGREPLFSLRIEQGRIRDGHGDLLADDVYCLDTPRILDCLEFDDRLRSVDVVDDMSCLAMELERLGAPEAARLLLGSYRSAAGDPYPESLRHHYTAYRAHVRAKVACLRHEQGDPEALGEAARLLDLAEDHLRAGRVTLVLVGGLPGTGKSTLARMLANARGWALLRSDEVRNGADEVREQDAAVPPGAAPSGGEGYQQGRYAPEAVEATYRALLDRARTLLAMGTPVVLDASWTSAHRRSEAAEVARATASVLVPLHCTAPAHVAEARIESRRKDGGDLSDATPFVARAMAADADPWPEAAVIDTSGLPEHTLAEAERGLSRLLA